MKRLLVLVFILGFAVPAVADGIPEFDFDTGKPLRITRAVGNVLDPQTQSLYTTLDSIDFGFYTEYVRICLRPDSEPIYIRFATTASNVTAFITGTGASATYTAPASTSGAFIDGVSGTRAAAPAFSLMASSLAVSGALAPTCETHPWRTRGITIHIVSGMATADVAGFGN